MAMVAVTVMRLGCLVLCRDRAEVAMAASDRWTTQAELLTRLGQVQRPVTPDEELDPKMVFQGPDLPADRFPCHPQLLAGPGKAKVPGRGFESDQTVHRR